MNIILAVFSLMTSLPIILLIVGIVLIVVGIVLFVISNKKYSDKIAAEKQKSDDEQIINDSICIENIRINNKNK